MDDMKSWFVTNDIIDFYELFVEKGFDSVNLIVNRVTEDLIRKDISEVSRPGDRCKILDAIANGKKRQNLTVSVKVNLGEGSTNVAQQSDGGTGSTSSQDLEWERLRLGYITNPIGLRAIYYMKTMPTFYEQVRPYVTTD